MEKNLNSIRSLPAFLQSYIEFRQHIEDLYGEFSNTEKGREFAILAKDTLSSHSNFLGLEAKLNEKKSHDGGVDIFWTNPETEEEEFFCQTKFKIRSKDELDNVFSKFADFEKRKIREKPQSELPLLDLLDSASRHVVKTKYIVVSLWKLDNLIKLYESSNRPSLEFYHQLVDDNRLEIIDGESLYDYFLDAYQKEYSIPQEIRFRSEDRLITRGNVYVGIISAEDLISIFQQSRNGIFFENVREFIGLGASDTALDINNGIFKTAREEPSKMIERNNGITFKASSIIYEDGWVVLRDAGIINGCQTTLCIVKAEPKGECYVPVKIVTTEDEQKSSDIARTANTQNRIDKINLELSDFIRPQLVKMSLAEIGVSLSNGGGKQAPFMAATIARHQVFKSDFRYLFIGLFSTPPRNIFISDYASIRFEDLKDAFSMPEEKQELNSTIARLLIESNQWFSSMLDKQDSNPKIMKVFSRFYNDQKGYKAYLIALTVFCMMGIEDEKSLKKHKVKEIVNWIEDTLENRLNEFKESLKIMFRVVAKSVIQRFSVKEKNNLDEEISQGLSVYMKSTNFSAFYLVYELEFMN